MGLVLGETRLLYPFLKPPASLFCAPCPQPKGWLLPQKSPNVLAPAYLCSVIGGALCLGYSITLQCFVACWQLSGLGVSGLVSLWWLQIKHRTVAAFQLAELGRQHGRLLCPSKTRFQLKFTAEEIMIGTLQFNK